MKQPSEDWLVEPSDCLPVGVFLNQIGLIFHYCNSWNGKSIIISIKSLLLFPVFFNMSCMKSLQILHADNLQAFWIVALKHSISMCLSIGIFFFLLKIKHFPLRRSVLHSLCSSYLHYIYLLWPHCCVCLTTAWPHWNKINCWPELPYAQM